MDIDEIVNRINYFRNEANLSARELSLRIGKHGGYINKLESKDFNLPVTVFLNILDELDVSCKEFFADNFMTFNKDIELANVFEKLSVENKKIVLDLMKNLK